VRRVGFIINSRVPELASLKKGMPPHAFVTGWDDAGSPMSFMRFRWIAEALNEAGSEWCYELYRPWRTYAAAVFLKAMGPRCMALAERLREEGTCVLFEANVDYYTRFTGTAPLDAMSPASEQRSHATTITQFANAVIASSRHLAEVCKAYNRRTAWVPDNVNLRLRPATVQLQPFREGRLQVWWSGMAAKLFEFLAAEKAFLAMADRIHLHIVTDDVDKARSRWPLDVRDRLEKFLAHVPHTLHRFQNIEKLLALYAGGGVIVSPRSLDAPYNLAHTEWKITLGMACEMPAMASPVPSYIDAAERAGENAVSICRSDEDWAAAFEMFFTNPASLGGAGREAFETVRQHYETGVVARKHAGWLAETCTRVES
jgi:glycosyltransferase involved in cell wall biosynthesis